MAYFRFRVEGGEFVVQGDAEDWLITFNGVRIGGLFPCADDAVSAVERARKGEVPAPNLTGVPDPPKDLTDWETAGMWVPRVEPQHGSQETWSSEAHRPE